MDVDFRVVQLMASRICHDLAGGVGALGTGAELLTEEGGTPSPDTLGLIRASAEQTSRRLQFLRMAFGQGGGEDGRVAFADLGRTIYNFLESGRTSLVWDAPDTRIALGAGKVLTNMCLIGVDCLPRGGNVAVEAKSVEGKWGFAVAARGAGARVPEGLDAALGQDVDIGALTPRTVHGYFLALLVRELGAELEFSTQTEGEVDIAALVADA